MEPRYEDKKCENCAFCDKLFKTRSNYICNNKNSEYYKQKVNELIKGEDGKKHKRVKNCQSFKPYSYCLTCMHFNKDAKLCKNKKSPYYNRYGVVLPKFGCEHKYDAGYVASTISDILKLDKKKSYSILLCKLKKELLEINADYQKSIDFYSQSRYCFGTALEYDEQRVEQAKRLKEEYLDNVWEYITDQKYIQAYEKFWSMLVDMNNSYNIVDKDKLLSLSSRK